MSLLNIRCNLCAFVADSQPFAFESNSIRNYQTLLIIDRDQITITEKLPSIIVTFKLTIGISVHCHLAQFFISLLLGFQTTTHLVNSNAFVEALRQGQRSGKKSHSFIHFDAATCKFIYERE